MEEIVMRRLAIKSFHIEEVEMGSTVALKGKKLLLNKNRVQELIDADDLITDIKSLFAFLIIFNSSYSD